jgi:transcriptional regulator with XRE-family HTH domain
MDPKKFGKKIKLARIENDMTQIQLAEAIGASQKSISKYETGSFFPPIEVLVKLAKTLNKTYGYFLDE